MTTINKVAFMFNYQMGAMALTDAVADYVAAVARGDIEEANSAAMSANMGSAVMDDLTEAAFRLGLAGQA